jgi:dihydrofolate reductase
VHAFVNDVERPIGTYLYGRRMYDVMRYWATATTTGDGPAVMRDYAQIWQAADKIVYSTTLPAASTAKTRVEPAFDPAAVQQLKATAAHDISIGGPTLAAPALKAGLVDECHLFVHPVVVGGGNSAFSRGVFGRFELLAERRFDSGVVHLHYRSR